MSLLGDKVVPFVGDMTETAAQKLIAFLDSDARIALKAGDCYEIRFIPKRGMSWVKVESGDLFEFDVSRLNSDQEPYKVLKRKRLANTQASTDTK